MSLVSLQSLGVLLLAGCASAPRPAAWLHTCQVPGLPFEARCGTYQVREDRTARDGRTIPLYLVVLPARGPRPAPDPVFFLEGGPGIPATESAAEMAENLAPLLEKRDIVLIDQRGTGRSNPLDCPLGLTPGALLDPEDLRACRAALEHRADLTRYTTLDAAEDLDEIRRALGLGPVNLVGASYGTTLAQAFLRLHPEAARTAVLIAPVDPTDPYPLSVARDVESGLDHLFADCAADAACHAAFPDPRADLATLMAHLEASPARVEIQDPDGGGPVTVELTPDLLRQTLPQRLYSVEAAARVPLSLHRAAAGDYASLARAVLVLQRHFWSGRSLGQILTIECSESLPPDRIGPEAVTAATAGTFHGDFRVRAHRAMCADWPRAQVPASFFKPVRTARPVLLLGGALDPILPPRHGEAVARHLPRSRLVVVAGESHFPVNDCTRRLLHDFLNAGSTAGLDTSCAATGRRPAFILR
ncbi:MAG TPA: alpha/beta fold hydrolase [Thermoanaerobaculia bacterium]|nr:alpha/beta fold hydrolase [Thermoanaerobaculia bacterium]